ncbi:MAG: hypothetical protein ABSH53_18455 [Holophaga sp.]
MTPQAAAPATLRTWGPGFPARRQSNVPRARVLRSGAAAWGRRQGLGWAH